MNSITVDLKNCYGITSLSHKFDFSKKRQNVVYAANGIMKSSLALTFKDVSEGRPSCDRVHKERETERSIVDEAGHDIAAENVFVVEPYNEAYKSNRMSTLLANSRLRERYENVRREIDKKKDALLASLGSAAGMKAGVEEALAMDIASDPNEFFKAVRRLKPEVDENPYAALADLKYAQIFSAKVAEQLKSEAFRSDIENYMAVYDRLVSNSTFFRKGAFNHNNAADVAKSLKANGFFKAEHSVYVNNKDVRKEIKTEKDLEKIIQEEKDEILNDADLKAQFERIDKLLTKNVDMKEFRAYLTEYDKLIPELANPDRLRQRLWIAYLALNADLLNDALGTYDRGRGELEEIVNEARQEATRWGDVLDEFNGRFSVPFIVTMENQHDVILKADAPSIRFRFKGHDGTEVAVEELDLVRILSNGEKRALYLLNIIFEVIARKEGAVKTIFVFDDIADSFDYKNKYAIIEYLRDITDVDFFYQIILTHNYDFYRTVSSRLDLGRDNKFHTLRSDSGVHIREEKYQNNPFKHWKEKLPEGTHDDFLIAMIPFVRNVAEFAGMEAEEAELTRYLHVKQTSENLTVFDLEKEFKKVVTFKTNFALPHGDRKVFDLLFERAQQACALGEEQIELETKIVLAMAIRIKAEVFMIGAINDQAFVDAIKNNQTFKLLQKVEQLGVASPASIKCLKQVVLMTPENIHINSFMYEPILDMSNHHLKKLFEKVSALPL
ncbi:MULTISPECIES: phage infection protein [Rhizobium]|uniref:phage infection protein n=1 Tax=Rhizobium TaxID=379 RepID=UPI0020CFD802|nr:phage infection protein [Rhizobium anhuiense]UTS93549.1 phage infection protein [Rhizobium anhuiense bv. trifolii]